MTHCSRQRCTKPPAPGLNVCRTHARDEADTRFSVFIRQRDGSCQNCGSRDNLQCAHLITRGALSVRFDPDNAVALCSGCHRWFTSNPHEWYAWIEKRIGAEAWNALLLRSRKLGSPDYSAVLTRLRGAA